MLAGYSRDLLDKAYPAKKTATGKAGFERFEGQPYPITEQLSLELPF
jgi:hypothetical protein